MASYRGIPILPLRLLSSSYVGASYTLSAGTILYAISMPKKIDAVILTFLFNDIVLACKKIIYITTLFILERILLNDWR